MDQIECSRCGVWHDQGTIPCVANVTEHTLEQDAEASYVCCECLKPGDVVLDPVRCPLA